LVVPAFFVESDASERAGARGVAYAVASSEGGSVRTINTPRPRVFRRAGVKKVVDKIVSKKREDRLSPPLSVGIRTGLTQQLENPRPVPFDLFDRYDSLLHGQAEGDHGAEDDHQRMDSDWVTIHFRFPFCSTGAAAAIVSPPRRQPSSRFREGSPSLFYGQNRDFMATAN
jgi:hypothetical protein